MNILAKRIIEFYQHYISPLFPGKCRFYPSCSMYAIEAFQKYGFPKALYLTIFRILKCNPLHPGGFDPVP